MFAAKDDPRRVHFLCASVLALALAIAAFRWLLFLNSDPIHCHALLTRGQWLDSKFSAWQPDGCMLHNYKPKDMSSCLADKQLIFVGDSVTRNLYYATLHTADPSFPAASPADEQKHSNHEQTTSQNIHFGFVWDPFLNSSFVDDLLSPNQSNPPFLVVLGSGLWYLRHQASSGGLPGWEARMELILNHTRSKENPSAVANHVAVLPVEKLVPSKLSEDRATSMKPWDIDAMNADLKHRVYATSPVHLSLYRPTESEKILLPLVFNDVTEASQTKDGLHYSQTVLKAQATILINSLCNTALPKKFPFDKTCCRSYPTPSIVQLVIVLAISLYGPIALYFSHREDRLPASLRPLLLKHNVAVDLTVFGVAIGLMYLADRTHIFLKEHKSYDPISFALLLLVVLIVGLATIKHTDKDQGFLNRDQTDEWKGWMQLVILVYHYLGASKISGIYNPVRVLVASYLFMTGYGHCFYYLKKADFGFLRIAQVLIRLNLLTVALAYSMSTNYFDYYFSPLVSFWFLIIYGTMRAGQQFNSRIAFVLVKIVASAAILTFIFNSPKLIEEVMAILKTYCGIQWASKEVIFRVKLDLWIVYAGMLAAIGAIKFKELRIAEQSYWPRLKGGILITGGVFLAWFMYFELTQESKFTYNLWHPYVSVIPIAGFVFLRNATPVLRSATSKAFAFIGTCSLETFIMQFHFWLAADTKGVLIMIPGTRLRHLNFVVSTIAFIWLSHRIALATGGLTDWLCGVQKAPRGRPAPQPQAPVTAAQVEAAVPRENEETRPPPPPPQPKLSLEARVGISFAILWLLNITWIPPS